MFRAEEIAAVLDPLAWDITAVAPERPAADPEGQTITLTDDGPGAGIRDGMRTARREER